MKMLYNVAGDAVKLVPDDHPVPKHLRVETIPGTPSPSAQRILDDLAALKLAKRAAADAERTALGASGDA